MFLCRIMWMWCLLITFCTLKSDEFSATAEQENILDQVYGQPIQPLVQLQWFGYVKAEAIYDSRQVFGFREDQVLYFPEKKLLDARGQDINARGTFDEYAIQTRIDLAGFGPDVGCTQSGFLIEGDFLGRTDVTIDSFDLRQAFMVLSSDGIIFLAGQAWHPICIPIEFPDPISFNTGNPMNPFALCPQFRFDFSNEHAELMISAIGFLGDRPFGPTQTGDKALRDSLMPDLNLLIKLKQNELNYMGVDIDVMRILPRLVTNLNYIERNPFTAASASFFTRINSGNFDWYTRTMYVEDAQVFEMIGGFAVHSIDPLTDERTYVPLRTIAFSTELIWHGTIEPGIFVGYVKNIGAKKTIIPNFGPDNESGVFSLGPDIAHVFRISTFARYYNKNFIIGAELEYTSAAYGTITNHGTVTNTTTVGNTRFLFATYYLF
ncbi:hypothetical protein BH09DEP1_BH09DEP1_0720 [soil metagenome]